MNESQIRKYLVERFSDSYNQFVQTLKTGKSKFCYGIKVYCKHPFFEIQKLEECITFQPKNNKKDVPLDIDKSTRILRETTEKMFDIYIQEEHSYLDGNYCGLIYVNDPTLSLNSITIEFSLDALIENNNLKCYVIELPDSEFDFNAQESIYMKYFDRKLKYAKFRG